MRADFNALIADVYSCVVEPAGWGDLLPRIARALGGHAAALQHQRRGESTLTMTHASGLSASWLADYARDWDKENPWRIRSLEHGWSQPAHMRHTAIHVSALVAPAELRRTALFNECLARADLYDCIGLPLFAGDDALWIAVFCGRAKNLFDDSDVSNARALAAHIGRAAHAGAKVAESRSASRRT
ncbi:MAG: GAF domain-containing protein, partial [Parvularculaceae bacterium]|nr:GAF domain-containing protein [Parvularculaceae bacterium]